MTNAHDAYPIVRALLLGLLTPVAVIVTFALAIHYWDVIVEWAGDVREAVERLLAGVQAPTHGRHRVEDHPPQTGYRPAYVVAGAELPQRPKGNEALKAEISLGWRPYTDATVTTARIEMAHDWPTPEEPPGALVLAGGR